MCLYVLAFIFTTYILESFHHSPYLFIYVELLVLFGFNCFLSNQLVHLHEKEIQFLLLCAFILFSVLFLPCIYNKCQEFWLFNVRRMTTHLWIRFIVIKSLDCFCFHIIHLIYATTIVKSFFVLERWNWNDVICTKYCSYVCIIHNCHNNNDNTFIWIPWFESS